MSAPASISATALLAAFERLTTAVWVFDIGTYNMVWANHAALALWDADSLEALRTRDFSDYQSATNSRLNSYLQAFAPRPHRGGDMDFLSWWQTRSRPLPLPGH